MTAETECFACGGADVVDGVCMDCGFIDSHRSEGLGIEPTFVWERQPDGDLELLRGNSAAQVFTKGRLDQLVGFRASDFYRQDPDVLDALRHAADSREIVIDEMTYRLRSVGDERAVKVAFRPGCRQLVLVTVLDVRAPADG